MRISKKFFEEYVKSVMASANGNAVLCVNPTALSYKWYKDIDSVKGGWEYIIDAESMTEESIAQGIKDMSVTYGNLEINEEIHFIKLRNTLIEEMLISAHDAVQANEGYEAIGVNIKEKSYTLIPSLENASDVYNYILPFNAVKAISSDEFITYIAQISKQIDGLII